MTGPWFDARSESGYGTLLSTVASTIDGSDPHAADSLRRAAATVESLAVAVTAAADFVRNEEGHQHRLGERWYRLDNALREAGALT